MWLRPKDLHLLRPLKRHTAGCRDGIHRPDYKSMKPYIDITGSAKKDAIKKMEEAFKKK